MKRPDFIEPGSANATADALIAVIVVAVLGIVALVLGAY